MNGTYSGKKPGKAHGIKLTRQPNEIMFAYN